MAFSLTTHLPADINYMDFGDIAEVVRISAANEGRTLGRTYVEDRLRDNFYDSFVAKVQSAVVGYLICRRDEEIGIATIDSLSVTPELRRCSIGSQLVRHLIWHLRPFRLLDDIVCAVLETNLAGQVFFRVNGFYCSSIVESEDQHGEPETLYMMYRTLRPDSDLR